MISVLRFVSHVVENFVGHQGGHRATDFVETRDSSLLRKQFSRERKLLEPMI